MDWPRASALARTMDQLDGITGAASLNTPAMRYRTESTAADASVYANS